MPRTKCFPFITVLSLLILVTGCASPTSVPVTAAATVPASMAAIMMPTATQTVDARLAAEIDANMRGMVDQDLFSGSVLVARDGQVIMSQGYGLANYELDAPNTPQTKFEIGSITKQFTSMAILLLQQQGNLNVQDPICQYIDNCPAAWKTITIHQLLTHTSGIHEYSRFPANYTDLPNLWVLALLPSSPTQIIDLFRDLPLDSPPGKIFSYSNSGYTLLGSIIEKASGLPYGTFLQQYIFDPLHMTNTGYYSSSDVIKNRASGYYDSTTKALNFDLSFAYAAGGLCSTVEDLYLWDQALYTDKLLSQTLRDEMFSPLVPITGCAWGCNTIGYGYGWMVAKQFDHRLLWHPGLQSGFSSEIDRYPDDKITILVLSNRQNVALNISGITTMIARLIFEGQ